MRGHTDKNTYQVEGISLSGIEFSDKYISRDVVRVLIFHKNDDMF